jgi:hypothetical protein
VSKELMERVAFKIAAQIDKECGRENGPGSEWLTAFIGKFATAIPEGWQPIETAPDDVPVVVGWLEAEDTDHPERYDFDQKEDGVWVRHEDTLQHAQSCAPPGSRMPSEKAPYTCWMPLPSITKHKGEQS